MEVVPLTLNQGARQQQQLEVVFDCAHVVGDIHSFYIAIVDDDSVLLKSEQHRLQMLAWLQSDRDGLPIDIQSMIALPSSSSCTTGSAHGGSSSSSKSKPPGAAPWHLRLLFRASRGSHRIYCVFFRSFPCAKW